MAEIRTKDEFYAELEQATNETRAFFDSRPDDRALFEDIELQLDIMKRRTAGDQVPTLDEKKRITLATLVGEFLAPGPGPDGANRDRATLTFKTRIVELHAYYVNWPGTPLYDLYA